MALNSGSGGGSAGAVRAGRAFVELYTRNNLAAGLNAAAADLKAFGRGISSIGLKFAGLGAAGVAGLLPISNTLSDLAKQGSIANALGLTSEQFTGIAGVAKSVGNDTKEFIESLVTLGKLGTDAAAGTEQASQAFAAMGLNANEFIKLRADEQFFQVFDAINKMQDPLQRTRALMLAFGEDGGKILLPLLGKSSDELRRMAAGFAISSDDMREATKATTAYNAATQTLSKAWQEVSIAAAPIVKILADGLSAAVAPVTEFVKQNREMVVGLGLAVGGVAALGVGMVAVGTAVSALGTAWTAFTGIVSGGLAVLGAIKTILLTPILAIPAALAAAGAAWLAFTEPGQRVLGGLVDFVSNTFGQTWANLRNGWSAVVEAVTAGDFQRAFTIATATVEVEWVRLTNFIELKWTQMINRVTASWKLAVGILKQVGGKIFPEEPAGLIMDGGLKGVNQRPAAIGVGGQNNRVADMFNRANANAQNWLKDQLGIEGIAQELVDGANVAADANNKLEQALRDEQARRLEAAQQRLDLLLRKPEKVEDWFGGGGDFGKTPMAAQLNAIALASRGTFGGGANAGFFGGSGGIGEKLLVEAKKGNELAEKLLDKVGAPMAGGAVGGLVFVGGK